jgi:serine/threonine protein kinase/WD40 repeat protein
MVTEEYPAYLPGLKPGSMLAGYRLEAKVGAGGMAVVYRARDERLRRLVGLKVLAPELVSDAAFRRRFIAESLAAAAVDDPHIIPVYEAGEADGMLFIAMRFVHGGDLRLVLHREGPLAAARTAEFISPVASALDAAHLSGLVHRDVKPGNILVDTRTGRPDHVYLSDFGISKGAITSVTMAGMSANLTGTGQFFGTPGYSAPEQIEALEVDGRADQYALACVTYELLTGGTPFQRHSVMAVLIAHVQDPPDRLTSRRPDLPAAVDAVMAKALAKTPGERFASCADFGDALRDALGLPSYHARGRADTPPHPVPPDSLAAEPRSPAVPRAPTEISSPSQPRSPTEISSPSQPRSPTEISSPAAGLSPVDTPAPSEPRSPADIPSPVTGLSPTGTLPQAAASPPVRTRTPTEVVPSLPASPVGQPPAEAPAATAETSAATAETYAGPAGADSPPTMTVVSLHPAEPEAPPEPEASPEQAAPAPDEPIALDQPLDAMAPTPEQTEPEMAGPEQAGAEQTEPETAEPETAELEQAEEIAETGDQPESFSERPEPDQSAVGPQEPDLREPDPQEPELSAAPDLPITGPLTAGLDAETAAEPDGALEPMESATASLPVEAAGDPAVDLAGVTAAALDPETRTEPSGAPAPAGTAATAATAAVIVTGPGPKDYRPGPQRDWRRRLPAIAAVSALVGAAAVVVPLMLKSPGGSVKAPSSPAPATSSTATPSGSGGTVNPARYTPSLLGSESITGSQISSVAFNPAGTMLALAGNDGLCLWDLSAARCTRTFPPMFAVAFSPDGTTLAGVQDEGNSSSGACGSPDGVVRLWNVGTGHQDDSFCDTSGTAGISGGALSVAFSPDGMLLAVGDGDGDTYVWNVRSGKQVTFLRRPGETAVNAVAFSPDGTILAVGDMNGSTYVWKVDPGTAAIKFVTTITVLRNTDVNTAGVTALAFSADGKTLAVGETTAAAHLTYLWNARTWALAGPPLSDPAGLSVGSLAFGPDGDTLAVGDGNGSVYLWNAGSRTLITRLSDPDRSPLVAVALSPNGDALATSDRGGDVYYWSRS